MGLKMNTDEELKQMLDYFGRENVPDPKHYPLRFEFLVKTYKHYLCMQSKEAAVKEPTND